MRQLNRQLRFQPIHVEPISVMNTRPVIGYLLLGVGLVLAIFGVNEFLAIDSCLDRGGGWDYAARRCSFDESPLGTPNDYDILVSVLGAGLVLAGGIVFARSSRENESIHNEL